MPRALRTSLICFGVAIVLWFGVLSVIPFADPSIFGHGLTRYTTMMAVVALIGAGLFVWRRRTETTVQHDARRRGTLVWIALAAALGLFAYAFISTQFATARIIIDGVVTPVPRQMILVPLIDATVTMLAGLFIMLAFPRPWRFEVLWWWALAMVPYSFAGWARMYNGQLRLWTMMGGAAVYQLVPLIAASVLVARFGTMVLAHQHGWRFWASMIGAVGNIVVIALVGSRSGVIMLGAFALAAGVAIWLARPQRAGRTNLLRTVLVLAGGLLVVAACLVFVFFGRRGTENDTRELTYRLGWHLFTEHPMTTIFGRGSGTVWPWLPYENGFQPEPPRSLVTGVFGQTLYHSHSVYLTTAVELGLVGLLLLGVLFAAVLVRWFVPNQLEVRVIAIACGAAMIGFAFDSYIFKNFTTTLAWWMAVWFVLAARPEHPADIAADPEGPDDVRSDKGEREVAAHG